MRFDHSELGHPGMAYNPFLLPTAARQTDFSMNSILTQPQHYLSAALSFNPAAAAAAARAYGPATPFPKLPHGPLPGPPHITAEDVLAHQSRLRPLGGFELMAEDDGVQDDPKVTLESKDLWEKFHVFGTEMVITKSGRSVPFNYT